MIQTNPFTLGLQELAAMQKRLGHPPRKRDLIPGMVNKLVRLAGLRGDPRERYFRLLATCALKNMEPRFRAWGLPRRKK